MEDQKQVDALYHAALSSGTPSVQVLACETLRKAAVAQLLMDSHERTLALPTEVGRVIGAVNAPQTSKSADTWRVLIPLLDAIRDAANTRVVA